LRFKPSDVETARRESAYIDTLIIPLIPVGFEEDMLAFSECSEMALAVSAEAERQLSGRAMLAPAFSYVGDVPVSGIERWKEAAGAGQFRFITLITADLRWKETPVEGLIYVPRLSLDAMSGDQRGQMITNFVGQVLEQLAKRWTAL